MNAVQKKTIWYLRHEGQGYAMIADRLALPVNTIKSHCLRHGLGKGLPERDTICRQCGAVLQHQQGYRARKFCSDDCRAAWWHCHPYLLNKSATYTLTCAHCGQTFDSYGNKVRKYCGHPCYIEARSAPKINGMDNSPIQESGG